MADHRTERGFDRLVAFSDGVVAIAITLLVLPLTSLVDAQDAYHPFTLISDNWGVVGAFIVTFFVTAVFWVSHHRIFEALATYDYGLAWLNMLWLMGVVFLPFASGVVNENGFADGAGVLYGGTMAVISLVSGIMVVYARSHPELISPQTEAADLSPRRGWTYAAYFLIVALVSLVAPMAASWLMLGLVVVGRILPRRVGKTPTKRGFDRLVNFGDAVVAIAITLLILPLADLIGEYENTASVFTLIGENGPAFWSFAVSFAVTAGYWLVHHHIFEYIDSYDGRLVMLNLSWLLCIVLLPFATALLQENGFANGTGVLYCGLLAAVSGILSLIGWYVARTPALQAATYDASSKDRTRAWAYAVYLVILGIISIFIPNVAIWGLMGLWVISRWVDR